MINVSETYFTKVKKGEPVDVKLDVYGDELFKGTISLIYPTIDATTRTFQIEIKLDNKDQRVRPGMFARATLNFGTADNVVVPDLAIVKQAVPAIAMCTFIKMAKCPTTKWSYADVWARSMS